MWFAAAHAGAALTPDCEVCLLTDRRFIQVQPSAAAERSAAHPAVCTRRSAACAPLDCRKARMLCLSCVTLAALRPHPNPTTNQPHSRRDPGRVGAMAVPNIVSSCRMEAIAYYGARWARSFVKKAGFRRKHPLYSAPPRGARHCIAFDAAAHVPSAGAVRSGHVIPHSMSVATTAGSTLCAGRRGGAGGGGGGEGRAPAPGSAPPTPATHKASTRPKRAAWLGVGVGVGVGEG